MNQKMKIIFISARVAAIALLGAGCGSDSDPAPAGPGAGGPAYVLATAVSSDSGATTYVKVTSTPPAGGANVDLTNTREFSGWSDLKVSGGKVFVSSGESPVVQRFGIDMNNGLVPEGEISFLAHTASAAMYEHIFISPEKAYLLGESGEYVIWNPTTLEIRGTIKLPTLDAREAIDAAPSLDRGMIVRDGRLYHTVAWSDYKNYKMHASSAIIVVDVVADRLLETIEVACPDLNVATMDAARNLYFSNWVYSPAATLVFGGAGACSVKLPAGSAVIDGASTLKFREVMGHEAAAVSVLGSGKALVSVFFEENEPFDPKKDDIFGWIFGANWKSYEIDLATRTHRPIGGLDWHSGGYYATNLDGSDYLLVPGDGYSSTTIYRLDPAGNAVREAHTKGWATRLERVR
jgi:hypothetical protein